MFVVGQAFAASWLLYLGVRCLDADNRPAIFLCAIAVVAGLTSLPLFVGDPMPDVFAGLYILAIALLIVFYETLMPTELTALWVLLVFSMLSRFVPRSRWWHTARLHRALCACFCEKQSPARHSGALADRSCHSHWRRRFCDGQFYGEQDHRTYGNTTSDPTGEGYRRWIGQQLSSATRL